MDEKLVATKLTWLSFMLDRLAGQNTLTARSQPYPFAHQLPSLANTVNKAQSLLSTFTTGIEA